MTATAPVKLDNRGRINVSKYFEDTASEVRITPEGPHRLIVEPVISLTAAELMAMTDPEIIQKTNQVLSSDYQAKEYTLEELRSKTSA